VGDQISSPSGTQHTSRNLLGFVAPWKDTSGKILNPLEIIQTRRFTIFYLVLVWSYVLLIEDALQGDAFYNLKVASEKIARMDPNELTSNPLIFLFSLLISPFAHWDTVHAMYVTAGIMFFLQSFEAHNNWKSAVIIFIGTSALTSIFMAIFYNVGFILNPDIELFSYVMSRSFRGGSIGMFGALGALAYHAKKPQFPLILVFLFEVWNYTSYGTDMAISIGHASSTLIGLIIWRWWNEKGDRYAESE
tara:strand:- start:3019 stop:3762 length:744 start_codon:yes stop_codon:yes gene_type:complete